MAVTLGADGLTYSDGSTQIRTATSDTTDRGRLISITTFTSNGTYTAPTYCTKVLVKVQAGGGGSAGYLESGGAGAYAEKLIQPFTAGSTAAVTVGGGGGGVGYYAAAGDGGSSSFGSYVSASGGYGANRNYSHTGGHGGFANNGDFNVNGGGGTGHGNSHGYGGVGRGGSSFFGGPHGVRHSGGEQIGPGAPGAGASGGITNTGTPGRTGASGIVIVYAYT